MKPGWRWITLIFIVGTIGFLWTWRFGYVSRIYRIFVPTGEIRTNQVRGINGIGFRETNVKEFDFYVAGHIYGAQTVKDHKPDVALLSALPAILKSPPAFWVSLGDMAEQSNPQEFNILDHTLLNQISVAIFNAVGNHVIANRELYEARYGKTFFTFKYGPARIILLDTEKVRYSLDDAQTKMLSASMAHALQDPKTQYIFIFMHKTLFFRNNVLAKERTQEAGPNEWVCYHSKKFSEIRDALIIPASSKKPVYLFAGDVGAWGNLTPYYDQHSNLPLFMYMTGLGDTDHDNILHVHVDDSRVNVEAIFLNTLTSQPLENYGPAYWENVATGTTQLSP